MLARQGRGGCARLGVRGAAAAGGQYRRRAVAGVEEEGEDLGVFDCAALA